MRTLLLSWLSRLDDPGGPLRPQRPQRPCHSNESAGPQAVRTPALVNERWEPGDPGSNWLGHLEQRAETLTHGCHPRETRRDVDGDNVCSLVSASASDTHTHTHTHTCRKQPLCILVAGAVGMFPSLCCSHFKPNVSNSVL